MEEFEDRFNWLPLFTETNGFKKEVLSDPKYRRSKEVTTHFYINEKGQRVLDSGYDLSEIAEMFAGAERYGSEVIIFEDLQDEEDGVSPQGGMTFLILQDKTEIDEQAVFDIKFFQAQKEREIENQKYIRKEEERINNLRTVYEKVKSQVTFEEFCETFKNA